MPEALQLSLVAAQLLGTVFAGHEIIGVFREALGMPRECDLPPYQKKARHREQAPGIGRRHEEERREHHRKIPVVDAAGDAAAVLHHKGLEGAEK